MFRNLFLASFLNSVHYLFQLKIICFNFVVLFFRTLSCLQNKLVRRLKSLSRCTTRVLTRKAMYAMLIYHFSYVYQCIMCISYSFITKIFTAPLQGYYSEALRSLHCQKEQFSRWSRMCHIEPWGTITVPMEAYYTQRMIGSALWKKWQEGQRVPSPVSLSKGSCNLWYPEWQRSHR